MQTIYQIINYLIVLPSYDQITNEWLERTEKTYSNGSETQTIKKYKKTIHGYTSQYELFENPKWLV